MTPILKKGIHQEINILLKNCAHTIEFVTNRRVQVTVTFIGSVVSTEELKEMVCQQFNLPWDIIAGSKKKREVTTARQVYCYLARTYLKKSFEMIGLDVNKNHASIMKSCENVTAFLFVKDQYVCSNTNPIIQTINLLNEAEKVQN